MHDHPAEYGYADGCSVCDAQADLLYLLGHEVPSWVDQESEATRLISFLRSPAEDTPSVDPWY